MSDGHYTTFEQTEGNEAFFPIVFTVIDYCLRRSRKYGFAADKINTVGWRRASGRPTRIAS